MNQRRISVQLQHGRRDAEGRKLCCHCDQIVKPPRRDWCSQDCVDRYLLETGDQNVARRIVWRWDWGVCRLCGVDTITPEYVEKVRAWGPERANWNTPRGFFDADHIVPLAEGGARTPQNLRTLCRPCHRRETAALRKRLAEARRKNTGIR